jgi:hypothetical protein
LVVSFEFLELYFNFLLCHAGDRSAGAAVVAPNWGAELFLHKNMHCNWMFSGTIHSLQILLDLVSITIKNGILFRKTVSGSAIPNSEPAVVVQCRVEGF